MKRSTFTKLVGFALIIMITAGTGTSLVQSQSPTLRITLKQVTQSEFRSAAFSPNGKYLATAGDHGTVEVWDATSGRLLHHFHPRNGPSIDPYFSSPSVDFDRNGETLISRWTGLTTIWDASTGKLIREVEGSDPLDQHLSSSRTFGDSSEAVADKRIADILVTASEKSETGETYPSHLAANSADGKVIATLRSSREAIDIWSLETGQRLLTLSATAGLEADLEGPPLLYEGVADTAYNPFDLSSESAGFSPLPITTLRRCTQFTIGGRLTRRVDVFGDEENQYRPVKGEQVFLFNAEGNELARTRTDRNGDYSFPNLCSGTYTVHPGIASPLLPSRYDPSSREITLPVKINEVTSPAHLDFVRKQPPPPRQPEFPGVG
jgi:SdrD B-like domain/Anaphase-promoting complex subunit 4 WD40 domain